MEEHATYSATVTSKGQLVIPSKLRRELNIKEGTQIVFEKKNGEVTFRPLTREYFEQTAGILPKKGKALKELLKERAKDKDR